MHHRPDGPRPTGQRGADPASLQVDDQAPDARPFGQVDSGSATPPGKGHAGRDTGPRTGLKLALVVATAGLIVMSSLQQQGRRAADKLTSDSVATRPASR